MLVVLVFLRSIRATLIAGVALPLSLIGTFGVMYFLNFSLDNLSLMALTIGTGFVVDDAIVMIENIVQPSRDGRGADPCGAEGRASEIGFTVDLADRVARSRCSSRCLFMTGIVGRMFREFALVLTIAVVVSAIVSLTLTPMMCGQLLRRSEQDHVEAAGAAGADRRRASPRRYRGSHEWVLRHQTPVAAWSPSARWPRRMALYVTIPKGFLPPEDTGLISAVTNADSSVSFEEMSRLQIARGGDRPRRSGRRRRHLRRRRRHRQRDAERRASSRSS